VSAPPDVAAPDVPAPEVAALVLAGGLSRRMGTDKALVAVEGTPMLARVCQVARTALGRAAVVRVITPWPERYAALDLAGAEFPDREPAAGLGPLHGFLHGLAGLATDWVLLLACDLPFLDAAVLRRWRALLSTVPPETLACLPRSGDGRWEPLCGYYRLTCRPALATHLAGGGRSFQGWLGTAPVVALADYPSSMLRNCNQPTDLPSTCALPASMRA